MQSGVIKAFYQCWLDDLKVGRNIKVTRCKQAVMTNMQDFTTALDTGRIIRFCDVDFGQNRVADRLKGLGNQGRTDRPSRIAAAEGQKPAAPTDWHKRRGDQVPGQVKNILQIILKPKPDNDKITQLGNIFW